MNSVKKSFAFIISKTSKKYNLQISDYFHKMIVQENLKCGLFLTLVTLFPIYGQKDYHSPIVDIHYDSDGKPIGSSSEPPFQTAPEAGYSMPPSVNSHEALRALNTGSYNAFVQRRLFNTSCALTVPLFSFTLPQRASQGTSVDLSNQLIFGLFSLLVVVLVFTVPIIFTGARPAALTGKSNVGSDSSSTLDHLMKSDHVLNFMGADLKNKIGLDPYKCLEKTICEAHRSSQSHGLLALPFQMFFPPPSENLPTSRATSFQMAAKEGKYTKNDCGRSYNCFFDLLDLGTYLVDWWQSRGNPQYDTY